MKKWNKQEKKHISNANKSSRYRSLAPTSDIENASEYISALSWAVSQKEIHNIAISGPYGSGKSSVINAFLNNYPKKKVLRISLAAFKFVDDKNEDLLCNQTKRLEEEILKQIFYSVSSKRIPKSRYRRISKVKWRSTIVPSIVFVLMLSSLLYFFQYERISELINRTNENLGALSWVVFLFAACLLMLLSSLIVKWVKENGKVREVNVLDKTGFIFEGFDEKSVFNKYMDEIVYFFENTKTEIVVIEDLDRYENSAIFSELRNLNSILNNNEKIDGRIKFIYAIRDNLFTDSKERTKFFEFIIPIVSVVSSSNSNEILRELLRFNITKDKSNLYDISGHFITMISPYINDMRDAICICNEFIIFKNTLKGNQKLDLNDEKMFALMVFKNLFPRDFSDLEDEVEDSIVRKAFSNKQELINKKSLYLEEKHLIEEKTLKEIKSESLISIKDLKLALLFALGESHELANRIVINGTSYQLRNMLSDSFDANNLKGKQLLICFPSGSSRQISNAENIVATNGNYFERIERIRNGLDNCIDSTYQRIAEIDREIGEIHSWSMKKAIDFIGVSFLDEAVLSNPLLVFMLRNGFIDETYENYINYFRPNSISKDEMNFILGVRNHSSIYAFSYHIFNAAQVFERLMDYEFKQPEVLNFDLVDYVLTHKSESAAANYLMEQLSNKSDASFDFIKAYINRGNCIEIFVHLLIKKNKHLWTDIINDATISTVEEFDYLKLIIKTSDVEDIIQQDSSDKNNRPLTTFLLKNEDSLNNLISVSVEKQLSVLEGISIIFGKTNLERVDDRIKEYIFSKDKYEMNVYMLRQLFVWKLPEHLSDFSRRNYSSIITLDYEPLSKRIAVEFDKYISDVFLKIESNTDETLDTINIIIELLLPKFYDLCIQVLNKSKVVWENINGCCSDNQKKYGDTKQKIWKYLISSDRVSPSIENVMSYFDSFAFDDELLGFFERNENDLIKEINSPIVSDEFKKSLLYSGLSENSFRHFIQSADFDFSITDFADLNLEKTKILIEENKLPFSADSWNKIHSLWPMLSYEYARKYPNVFVAELSQVGIDQETLINLLQSDEFSNDDKYKILNQFDTKHMTKAGAEMLSTIDYPIPKFYSDYAWNLLNVEHRINLLVNQISNYSLGQISVLLEDLGNDYSSLVAGKRHQYSIPYTDLNGVLTEELHRVGYLTSRKVINSDGDKTIPMITGFVKEII